MSNIKNPDSEPSSGAGTNEGGSGEMVRKAYDTAAAAETQEAIGSLDNTTEEDNKGIKDFLNGPYALEMFKIFTKPGALEFLDNIISKFNSAKEFFRWVKEVMTSTEAEEVGESGPLSNETWNNINAREAVQKMLAQARTEGEERKQAAADYLYSSQK